MHTFARFRELRWENPLSLTSTRLHACTADCGGLGCPAAWRWLSCDACLQLVEVDVAFEHWIDRPCAGLTPGKNFSAPKPRTTAPTVSRILRTMRRGGSLQ